MIGAYLQAFIRRYAGQAWAACVPGVDSDICKRVYTHDPQNYDFHDGDLPSLYLFRQGSAEDPQNTTEDYRVEVDLVPIFWVLPPTTQIGKQPARSRAISQVAKLIGTAFRRGRDPSYIIEGDPDPQAATEGSVVIRHAGAMRIDCGRWRSGTIAIKRMPRAEDAHLFDACIGAIRLTEHIKELPGVAVPAVVGPTLENVFPAAVRATTTVEGVTSGEYREPEDLLDP